MEPTSSSSFLARNEFLLRRLFSLCGLVPVGAYMVVHLVTNASLMDGAATFQKAVYQIHGLGSALVLVEWLFIFLPLIFHAVLGVVIVRGGLPNSGTYNYTSNIRYTLQRATGLVAFAFIFLHVFHMHGWFHFEPWLRSVQAMGGAQFRPYNAGSSAASALQGSVVWVVFYAIGVLSCVFHLANGIWSAGIRWGVWISPAAMRRASFGCTAFGVLLGVVSVAAIIAPLKLNVEAARKIEDEMYEARAASHEITPNEHKRSERHDATAPSGATQDKDSQDDAKKAATADGQAPKAAGPSG